jgi:hypothetical protein
MRLSSSSPQFTLPATQVVNNNTQRSGTAPLSDWLLWASEKRTNRRGARVLSTLRALVNSALRNLKP